MDKPYTIQIESSNRCNGRCTFCPHSDMTRIKGEMTDHMFRSIVKQGMDMGVTNYIPFLNGEPFMFRRLYKWLDYLEKRNLTFTLYTNASLLTWRDLELLNKYKGLKEMVFSVHGYDKESYELHMNFDYDKIRENVQYFVNNAKFKCTVYMICSAINIPGIDEFKKTWTNNFIGKYVNWAGDRPASMAGKQIPCARILGEITIYCNGIVNQCCMDIDGKSVLGDLRKQSLKEIWESNQWMRDKHKELDFKELLCEKCNFNIV